MLHWGILKKVEISIKPETERKDFVREQKKGFSLMELMVVLLIVAIIAAASAPMVSRKLARDAAQGDSPWVFTGTSNSIAYNMAGDNNSTAIIGTNRLPAAVNAANRPKLYIESNGNESQIGFGRRGVNNMLSLTMDTQNNRVGFSNAVIPNQSVVFGIAENNQTQIGGIRNISIGNRNNLTGSNGNNIIIGHSSDAINNSSDNVIIGSDTHINGQTRAVAVVSRDGGIIFTPGSNSVSVGADAMARGLGTIAIGSYARDGGDTTKSGIAIGVNAFVSENTENAIAIGSGAIAMHQNSIAIGSQARTKYNNQIVLGTANTNVYIPGNLIVANGIAAYELGVKKHVLSGSYMYSNCNFSSINGGRSSRVDEEAGKSANVYMDALTLYSSFVSDRRLKNVGEKFTGGLDKIKKLEVFNYTFKKDEAKTPHVGVIAQVLKKSIP